MVRDYEQTVEQYVQEKPIQAMDLLARGRLRFLGDLCIEVQRFVRLGPGDTIDDTDQALNVDVEPHGRLGLRANIGHV